jgi:hypothetical protein
LSEKLSGESEIERTLKLLLLLLLLLVRVVMMLMLLLLGSCRRCLGLLLFGLRRAEVGVPHHGVHVHPVVFPVSQTLPDEDLGGVGDGRLVGKVYLGGLEDDVLFEDGGLRLVVAERLEKQKLNLRLVVQDKRS